MLVWLLCPHQTKSFQFEQEDKGWYSKKRAFLSKYLPCCPDESLRLPLCVTTQAQVIHPSLLYLTWPVAQASTSLKEAGLEQPLCPAQRCRRLASELGMDAWGSSRPFSLAVLRCQGVLPLEGLGKALAGRAPEVSPTVEFYFLSFFIWSRVS